MPRKSRAKPKWPALTKRSYGAGSLSRDVATGEIRARLPKRISPTRKSRLFAHDEEAEAHAWIDAHLQPLVRDGERHTLRNWSGYWIRTYVQPIRSPQTVERIIWAIRKLRPILEMPLEDVRISHLQGIAGELAGQLGNASLIGVVGIWRACLQAAVDDLLIQTNPASRIILPKAQPTEKRERRHMTAQEMAAIWQVLSPDHRFEAAYALMLGCGIRIGEILGLRWEHVDLENRRAWIQWQWTNGRFVPTPKGRNPHWIRLPERVVDALRRQRERQPVGAVLVMQSEHGRRRKRDRDGTPWPWNPSTIAKDLASLLVAAGIDPATPHASRHGLASYWLDSGVPAAVVAERLGHSDPGITHKFYSHASREGHERADELTDRLAQNGHPGIAPGTLGDTLSTQTASPSESKA